MTCGASGAFGSIRCHTFRKVAFSLSWRNHAGKLAVSLRNTWPFEVKVEVAVTSIARRSCSGENSFTTINDERSIRTRKVLNDLSANRAHNCHGTSCAVICRESCLISRRE